MNILQLPTELLDVICRDCRSGDITRLRLTCKTLCYVAAPHLLKELKLYLTEESISTAERLFLSNPRIGKGVQSCWLQADQLPRHHNGGTSFDQWEELSHERYTRAECLQLTDLEGQIRVGSGIWSKVKRGREVLGQFYERYIQVAAEQKSLATDGRLFHRLCTLFKFTPKVTQIWLTEKGKLRETTIEKHRPFREAAYIPYGSRNAHEYSAIFRQLINAAAHSDLKLQTLVAPNLHHTAFQFGHDEMCKVANSLASVHKMQLYTRHPLDTHLQRANAEVAYSRVKPHLPYKHFFTPAHNLRVLYLKMDSIVVAPKSRLHLKDLITGIHFPHLERLSLTDFDICARDLADFLLQHPRTLRRLRLVALNSSESGMSLRSFFEAVAGQLTQLEVVKLRGCFLRGNRVECLRFSRSSETKILRNYTTKFEQYVKNGGPSYPENDEQERPNTQWHNDPHSDGSEIELVLNDDTDDEKSKS